MGSIHKLSLMNSPIIAVKRIYETINLKFWLSKHLQLKRYCWKKFETYITEIDIYSYFWISSEAKGVKALIFPNLVVVVKEYSDNFLPTNWKGWGVKDAPLRSYERLKNENSTGGNRSFLSSLKNLLSRFELRIFSHCLEPPPAGRTVLSARAPERGSRSLL